MLTTSTRESMRFFFERCSLACIASKSRKKSFLHFSGIHRQSKIQQMGVEFKFDGASFDANAANNYLGGYQAHSEMLLITIGVAFRGDDVPRDPD